MVDEFILILHRAMLLLYVLAFCRVTIGTVFFFSFLTKVGSVPGFSSTVASFELLPKRLSTLAAILFLSGELAVVVMIIVGDRLLPLAFALALLLLLLFSIGLLSVLLRNIETTCNCFGSSDKRVSVYEVWRNGGFALCSLTGLVLFHNTDRVHLGLAEWGVIGIAALCFAAIWVSLRDVVELFRTV